MPVSYTHLDVYKRQELAIRLRQRVPAARIVFAPDAVIRHRVTADRERFGYFVTRCAAEGTSKAKIARMVGATATSNEQTYVCLLDTSRCV